MPFENTIARSSLPVAINEIVWGKIGSIFSHNIMDNYDIGEIWF